MGDLIQLPKRCDWCGKAEKEDDVTVKDGDYTYHSDCYHQWKQETGPTPPEDSAS
jgi:hypothetical protein